MVQCRACQVPHHRDCWEENGGCTTFGCQETSFSTPVGRIEISASSGPENERATSRNGGINKFLGAALVMALLVIGLLGFNLIQGDREETDPSKIEKIAGTEEEINMAQRLEEKYDPEIIDVINEADYMIDYEHGTIPLSEVEVGARLVDPAWEWEFRTGPSYSKKAGDEIKSVTWLVVAKDHYDGLEPHVTLLSEELIGRFPFDNSTDRRFQVGCNHWGESGTTNASHGLRPWLNSTGIHSSEGFYQAFSYDFKRSVITTNLPNKDNLDNTYSTSDRVFIPSTTELGATRHGFTRIIGESFAYFVNAQDSDRIALLMGQKELYWTRSPTPSATGVGLRCINAGGGGYDYRGAYEVAKENKTPVRPALNLQSDTLVSEIP